MMNLHKIKVYMYIYIYIVCFTWNPCAEVFVFQTNVSTQSTFERAASSTMENNTF